MSQIRRRLATATVLNIAHRGARAFAPENTLAAFEKARDLACDMCELDVHMSRDNVLVVHHDDQLNRCTNVAQLFPGRTEYYISNFTWDELQTLDAGSWYVHELSLPADRRQAFLQGLTTDERERFISHEELKHFGSGLVRIPSLEEVLEFAARTGVMLNVELKNLPRMYPGIAEAAVTLIKSRRMEGQVLVSSFDHELLVEVRRLSSDVATGVLSGGRLAKVGDYLKLLDADAYHPGCYDGYDSMGFGSVSGRLDPRGIAAARAASRGVNVWTCNDLRQMRQLIDAGVTGLISDYPNRVREVLSDMPQRSAASS